MKGGVFPRTWKVGLIDKPAASGETPSPAGTAVSGSARPGKAEVAPGAVRATVADGLSTLLDNRKRDLQEINFDIWKNDTGNHRLRASTDPTALGRLFLGFLGTVLRKALERELRQAGLLKKHTVNAALDLEARAVFKIMWPYCHCEVGADRRAARPCEARNMAENDPPGGRALPAMRPCNFANRSKHRVLRLSNGESIPLELPRKVRILYSTIAPSLPQPPTMPPKK